MKRNRRNAKLTLLGLVSHEQIQLIGSIFIFGIVVFPLTIVMVTLLLTLQFKDNFSSIGDGLA